MNIRNEAFFIWYKCGQNLTETVKGIEAEGYIPPARQTLAVWRDEDNWIARAVKLDMEKLNARDALLLTEDEQLLASLKKHKEKYEAYFDEIKKPDAQATYAYNGLLKTIQETAQRTIGYKRAVFADFYNDMLNFITELNPELAANLEAQFDKYTEHISIKIG